MTSAFTTTISMSLPLLGCDAVVRGNGNYAQHSRRQEKPITPS